MSVPAIVFAVSGGSASSPQIGLIHPQYLPALAQSRLLQLRCSGSQPESSVRSIRSWFRSAVTRPSPQPL